VDKKKKIIFDWLDDQFRDCTIHSHCDYPQSYFYKKGNIIIGEQDVKNNYFWVHNDEVWGFIEKVFTMGKEDVRDVLMEWFEYIGNKKLGVGYIPLYVVGLDKLKDLPITELKYYTPLIITDKDLSPVLKDGKLKQI